MKRWLQAARQWKGLHARDLALGAANLLLLAYVVYLLVTNFLSQTALQESGTERFSQEFQKQANAIGYFYAERRRDLIRLAQSPEVLAYYESRALGMSVEYGLRASLVQIGEVFDSLLRERSLEHAILFDHLRLIDQADGVLVDRRSSAGGEVGRGAVPSMDRIELVMQRNGDDVHSRIDIPVRFKNHTVAHIAGCIPPKSVFDQQVKGRWAEGERWAGLYAGNELLAASEIPGPSRFVSETFGAPSNPEREWQALNGRIVFRAPIPDTGFVLATVLPRSDILGASTPVQQLLGLGAMTGMLLFGAVGFLRHRERKRMDESLRESRERLALTLDATNDGIWDWDCRTGACYFSSRWFAMLGYEVGSLPGRIETWESLVHPEDLAQARELIERHWSGELPSYECEIRYRTRPGGWMWILTRGKVIARGTDGTPLRMVGTHTDITARKRIESELAENNRTLEQRANERTAMLLQSEKMASLGQLAAGVAHEINNPAGYVLSNLNTLSRYVQKLLRLLTAYEEGAERLKAGATCDEVLDGIRQWQEDSGVARVRADIQDLLAESEEGMGRIRKIVADLKDFSHVDRIDAYEETDVNALIRKTISVAWNELKYKAEVGEDLKAGGLVRCNSGQIGQVILNLLVNAAQAIPERGRITIHTETWGGTFILRIADTGVGIPPAILAKIFDPFFTTKEVGKGTGLGLHIAQKIVHTHGGRIEVESAPGEGTAFTVILPVAGPEAGESGANGMEEEAAKEGAA